jgi:NodT family efflux transporter outer membrane factor (OMF) lipoprotein
MKRSLILLLLAGTGCASLTTSPVPSPDVAVPAAYDEASAPAAAAVPADWWKAFDAQQLSQLVAEALQGSPDLAIAGERVQQAQAAVRIAGASLFPAVDAQARTSRQTGGGNFDSTSAGLTASYELDVWGRNGALARSAQSSAQASRFDRETVRLSLVAGVANAYFEVLALRSRLAIARDNLAIAERVLGVVEARYKNGAASGLDLSRQRTAVESQRAAIPALELQERQTLAALAILIGRAPEGFNLTQQELGSVAVPSIAPGLPSDLLTRRPDVASAEASLVAANADLAAARAALFPSISLTGAAGKASDALLSLAGGPGATLSLAASVLQPIFDGGRLRAQRSIAESRERELVQSYRAAILAALADVERALAATSRTAEQEQLQSRVVDEAKRSLSLAEIRYKEGADDLLSTLDAQRTLFQAQDQLASLRLSRLEAAVALYKALGGPA